MKILEYTEETLIGICLTVMTSIAFCNVVSRYILHASWAFTEEITCILFVWVTFLGGAVAVKRKGHLGFSALADLLSPKMQKVVTIFGVVCSVLLFVILCKYGVDMVISQYNFKQTTAAMGFPEWVFGLSIPIGSIFMIIRFIELGYKELRGGKE